VATAILFDRDQVTEVGDWSERLPRVGRSAILWIDLERPNDDEIRRLADALELNDETVSRLSSGEVHPSLDDCGTYLHVTAIGLSDSEVRQTTKVDCLVSERWLVTIRESSLAVVDRFRERAGGSGDTGRLDGLGFLANLLEWALTSYLGAFEELERGLEEIDARTMSGRISSTDDMLGELVAMRKEVGRLRRALVSHREVILALTRPELEAIASSDSAERFASLRERLEEAVQASRDSRESIVGSFDVLIASTGRRTNEIMKVLTLASVLLLPGALIAGVMGMNFQVGLFETAANFWIVVAVIVAVAVVTLVVARARDWI
jgi:magnesium transporter